MPADPNTPRLTDKSAVEGALVKLLRHRVGDRGMVLIPERSRCVREGEIHELVVTDAEPGAGDVIDRVGFVGFVVITAAGVLDAGDKLVIGGQPVGVLLGFDDCHAPNHLNILMRADDCITAADLQAAVGDRVIFRPTAESLREPKPLVVARRADGAARMLTAPRSTPQGWRPSRCSPRG